MALQRLASASAKLARRGLADTAAAERVLRPARRPLFHELRDPPPVALTINQRADWPLTDLKRIPAHSVSAMNSLELTHHAERLCARSMGRSPTGDWDAILGRFSQLVAEMDTDLSIRLLRCLPRASFSAAALREIVPQLPRKAKSPSNLSCLSSALLDLRSPLGDDLLSRLFEELEADVLNFSPCTWGLSAPMMLVSLVRRTTVSGGVGLAEIRSESSSRLVEAIGQHAAKMGPRHLEISAYCCARLCRGQLPPFPARGTELAQASRALLEHGTRRVERFVPRSLLDFFIAMERLAGPVRVAELAVAVAQRLQRCTAEELETCSPGDKYRSALCLLRAGKGEGARSEVLKALKVLLDQQSLESWSLHAREALQKRLSNFTSDPELGCLQDLLADAPLQREEKRGCGAN